MPKPTPSEYPEYFGKYIELVSEENLKEAFTKQLPNLTTFLASVNEDKAAFAYAPGKWTLKELLQHTIDTERIFDYRALCYARKEPVSLPSFDENLYAENSYANNRTWNSMSDELINLRRSTEDLFTTFSEEVLQQKGLSNNNSITINSLGFIIIGHVYHHIKISKERYGV